MTEKINSSSTDQSLSESSFVTEERVRLLYMQAPISNTVAIIISLPFYFLLQARIDSSMPLVWFLLLVMTASYRIYLWYSQKTRPEAKSATSWLKHYLVGCGLVGASWSVAYPFIYGTDPVVWAALLMLAFGVISSAISVLSVYMPAFIFYTYPQGLVLCLTLLHFEDTAYSWLTFAGVIYMIMMTLFAYKSNRSILHSIHLQEQNASLINELNKEVNQREALIDQRTLELEKKNNELINEAGQRQKTEDSLQQANANLDATLQAIPDLLFELDEKGQYINLWAQNTALLIAQKEALIGHNITEFLPTDAVRVVMAAIHEAAVNGTSHGHIISLPLKQGEHWFELSTSRKQCTDSVSHFLMLSRDITDKQEIEAELDRHHAQLEEMVAQRTAELVEARDRAEHLSRVKSEFLANMSHEIRTPLHGVLGLSRIGEHGVSAEKSLRLFTQIRDSGEHLLRVVNDILDFSKIEAGKLTIEMQPFDLSATIGNMVSLVRNQAKEKGLSFDVALTDGLPAWVNGDALRLEQIMGNLLSNAIKFTEQGEVKLDVSRHENKLQFRVSDTGVGISAEHLNQLFKPFEQGDSSTTRRFGGTGLGLAISHNLVQMMGGHIHANSRLGEGSEFTLSLPLQTVAPVIETNSPALQTGKQPLEGIRVLAAEDIEINRLILADLLNNEGASLTLVENGQQALDQLEEQGVNAFDILLMDIQMPVMDGYTAMRHIQKIAPDLPVIGLTAHALDEEKQRCLDSGMVDHVAKPIDTDTLVATIQQQIKARSH